MAVDRTIVECDWLYLPEVVASGKDVSHSVELFHRVNQQDFEACERCQAATDSRVYAEGGVLVPSEAPVISQYYAWYRALMGITADGRPPGGDPAPPHAAR